MIAFVFYFLSVWCLSTGVILTGSLVPDKPKDRCYIVATRDSTAQTSDFDTCKAAVEAQETTDVFGVKIEIYRETLQEDGSWSAPKAFGEVITTTSSWAEYEDSI